MEEETLLENRKILYRAHHRAMALLTTHGKCHAEICEILQEDGFSPVVVRLVMTDQEIPDDLLGFVSRSNAGRLGGELFFEFLKQI